MERAGEMKLRARKHDMEIIVTWYDDSLGKMVRHDIKALAGE